MLRVVVQENAAGAKGYFTGSTGKYYTEGQELPGVWGGIAARRLALVGEVTRESFEALCDNKNPDTGKPLTARTKAARRVGYDLNFHVPKSVSLLYGLTQDEGILDAFRTAVSETMQELEREAKTRVRTKGRDEERTTGNLVWSMFVHTTSRPVNGIPDPHLHAHCFTFNATFDSEEGRWKAAEMSAIKSEAPYFEAAFHSRLALRLRLLGFGIAGNGKSWEIAGIPREVLKRFSLRTELIETEAARRGITDAKAKDALGAKTRERKREDLPLSELRKLWRERLTAAEAEALEAVYERKARERGEALTPTEAMARATLHVFERESVVPVRRLLAAALRFGFGNVSVEDLEKELGGHGLIIREKDGERFATSRHVLEEERGMLAFARDGRGSCHPLIPTVLLVSETLSEEQKRAAVHIWNSKDRVILLRGGAGTGKTTLMREAVSGIESGGKKVLTLAPSADASRGVLRKEGFQNADTVARFLLDDRLQAEYAGQVVWIDEAGLLGTQTLAKVCRVAERLGLRLILSGDNRQHGSVERGAALRLLETEAGLVPAEVTDIRRQKGVYREAVSLLSVGRTAEAFTRLDSLGWIKEIPSSRARNESIATHFVNALFEGKTALVVSPTHLEGRLVTLAIRDNLRTAHRLGETEVEVPCLRNKDLTAAERSDSRSYEAGDVVEFHQNASGFKAGSRYTVRGAKGSSLAVVDEAGQLLVLPLRQVERFTVYRLDSIPLSPGDTIRITKNVRTDSGKRLSNGQVFTITNATKEGIRLSTGDLLGFDFAHLTHGYVTTSHASQGKTVDRVFIAQGRDSFTASSREQFYVSASRARDQVVVFTDDKHALKRSVDRSDPRPSATELLRDNPLHSSAVRAWLIRRAKRLREAMIGGSPPGLEQTNGKLQEVGR